MFVLCVFIFREPTRPTYVVVPFVFSSCPRPWHKNNNNKVRTLLCYVSSLYVYHFYVQSHYQCHHKNVNASWWVVYLCFSTFLQNLLLVLLLNKQFLIPRLCFRVCFLVGIFFLLFLVGWFVQLHILPTLFSLLISLSNRMWKICSLFFVVSEIWTLFALLKDLYHISLFLWLSPSGKRERGGV